MKVFDIFISYRNNCSADRAQLLLALLESNGYRGRISFDKDNLTGLFDTTLVHRIDNCQDFIIIVSPDTFKYLDKSRLADEAFSKLKDYNEFKAEIAKYTNTFIGNYESINSPLKCLFEESNSSENVIEGIRQLYFGYKNGMLYEYLASCTEQEFEDVIVRIERRETVRIVYKSQEYNVRLEEGEHLDFVRIELGRAINLAHKRDSKPNIVPLVTENTDTFSFANLDLPNDLVEIKRFQTVTYSESSSALFKDVIPKLIPRLQTRPYKFKRLKISLLAIFVIVSISLLPFIKLYIGDCNMLDKCKSHNDYVTIHDSLYYNTMKKACNDSISRFEQWEKTYVKMRGKGKQLPKDSIKMNWSADITMYQLKTVLGMLDSMMYIKVADFEMGTNDYLDIEGPAHTVHLSSDFYMYKYEMTRTIWYAIMNDSVVTENGLLPMTNISWNDCQSFIVKLNNLTGLKFALPTEAQWEYAANGGDTKLKYAGSNNIAAVAYYKNNSKNRIHDVGKLSPDSFELYDMSGNVYEWCSDWSSGPYNKMKCTDPRGPEKGTKKIIRGGDYTTEETDMGVTYRDAYSVNELSPNIGFRIILYR